MSEHKPSAAAVEAADNIYKGDSRAKIASEIDRALAPERERVQVLREAAQVVIERIVVWESTVETIIDRQPETGMVYKDLRTALAAFDKEG